MQHFSGKMLQKFLVQLTLLQAINHAEMDGERASHWLVASAIFSRLKTDGIQPDLHSLAVNNIGNTNYPVLNMLTLSFVMFLCSSSNSQKLKCLFWHMMLYILCSSVGNSEV